MLLLKQHQNSIARDTALVNVQFLSNFEEVLFGFLDFLLSRFFIRLNIYAVVHVVVHVVVHNLILQASGSVDQNLCTKMHESKKCSKLDKQRTKPNKSINFV